MLVDFDYIVFFLYFVFNSLLEDCVSLNIFLYESLWFRIFKLARSVLLTGSFEFIILQYFNSTFMNLKIDGLVLKAKCKIVVFIVHRLYLYAYKE